MIIFGVRFSVLGVQKLPEKSTTAPRTTEVFLNKCYLVQQVTNQLSVPTHKPSVKQHCRCPSIHIDRLSGDGTAEVGK